MPKHWNEFDGRVHCEEAGGAGYTLCGAALEGENGNQLMIETAVTINCADCIRIIEHCKRIRPGEYASTKRAQR